MALGPHHHHTNGVTIASHQHDLAGTRVDYLLGNHQGSITTTINAASGAVSTRWYDPYGATRGPAPTDSPTTTGWLNQHEDPTGLTYLNNRYHDPILGTFITPDPLVTTTWEPYLYAGSNPTTNSDPTGLAPGISQVPDGGSGLVKPIDIWARQWLAAGPWWTPKQVSNAVRSNDALRQDLEFLNDVLQMPQDEFRELWEQAELYPEWDWTNDGCSDSNWVTAGAFGCIRHDFLYRNQRRLDADYGLDGALRENNHEFKGAVDGQLRDDIKFWSPRAWLVQGGVMVGGSGFYGSWDVEEWEAATQSSPYGNNPDRVTPGASGRHPVARWWESGWQSLRVVW